MTRSELLPALPILGLAYIAGTAGGAIVGGPWLLTLLVAALVALAASLRGERRAWLLLAMVALAGSGHARIAALDDAPASPLPVLTGTHEVVGAVRADAAVQGTQQRVDLDVESVDGTAIGGGIRLRLFVEGEPLRAGERIRVTAELEPPPPVEAFDYAAFLRARDIALTAAFPRDWARLGTVDLGWRGTLLDFRRTLVARIEHTLPEPAAALAAGVLVGEHSTLPNDLDEALRATGTTHLIVVSGQNVALLLGIAVSVLSAFMSRRRAAVVALVGLPAYVIFVGAEPPVIRAAIMAVAVVAASVTGRRTPGWIYLAYAAAVMLAVDPALIRDVAFQLSAAATAGITILAPALRDAILTRWPMLDTPGRGAVLAVVATAAGAALAVLPVQIAAFQTLAPWTVLANVLVAPLYEVTVVAAALAALLGGGGSLGQVVALPIEAFIALVEALAALPHAEIPVSLPLAAGIVFLGLLAAATGALLGWTARHIPASHGLSPEGSQGSAVFSFGLAIIAGGLWWGVLTPAAAIPRVVVLDVGQGLAVLVQDGTDAILIDAGPPDGSVVVALGEAGFRDEIDALVVSHTDNDHLGGLSALVERFDLGAVYLEPTVAILVPGAQPLDIGDRVHVGAFTVEVLAPPVVTRTDALASDNNGSLVLLVSAGERRVLVTGDIEANAEAWLAATGSDLRADVLVVPHHGSRTSSTTAFLDAVAPSAAVIPVGDNPYGHPHPEVVERYVALPGLQLYRTDEDGNVTISTDGEHLWIRTGR